MRLGKNAQKICHFCHFDGMKKPLSKFRPLFGLGYAQNPKKSRDY